MPFIRKVSTLRAHLSFDLRLAASSMYQLGKVDIRGLDNASRREFFRKVEERVPSNFGESPPELALHGMIESALKALPDDIGGANNYRGYTQSDWLFCLRSLSKFFTHCECVCVCMVSVRVMCF